MEIIDSVRPLINWLHLHPGWAGFVTFLISLAESLAIVGLLVPGTVIMTAIGTLIGAGVLPAFSIIIWAILGAILGDSISYQLGYRYNDRIREYWPFRKHPNLIKQGEVFFQNHGGKSVFLGRFVGPMRPIVPLVAGMLRMKRRNFFISNVISGLLWAPSYMLPGMLIGAASLELEPKTATRFLILILAVLLAVWIGSWLAKLCFGWLIRGVDRLLDRFKNYIDSHAWLHILSRALQDPAHPTSHSQLSCALIASLLLVAFVGLASCVYVNGTCFSSLNYAVYNLLMSFHTLTLTKIFVVITSMGYRWVIIPPAIIVILWLLCCQRFRAAIHFFLLTLGSALLVGGLKNLIISPRPGSTAEFPHTNSFPSGHSTMSVVILGFMAVLLAKDRPLGQRKFFYGLATLLAGLILLSRLYLGVHWLVDVIGASLLGIGLVLITTISFRRQVSAPIPLASTAALFLVSLSLFFAYDSYHMFNKLVKKYTPTQPHKTITVPHWWKSQIIQPYFRTDRFGRPVDLFNLQWHGDLAPLEKQLTQAGWQKTQPLTFTHTIQRLTGTHQDSHLPLLHPVHLGRQPSLVLYKTSPKPPVLIVIRLWPSNISVENQSTPLWLGTVDYKLPRGYRIWRYKAQKNLKRSLPPPIEQLKPTLAPHTWKQLTYSTEAYRFYPGPKRQWQGGVLLMSDQRDTLTAIKQ